MYTHINWPGDRIPPGIAVPIGQVTVTGPSKNRPYHRINYTDTYGQRHQLSGGRNAAGAIQRAEELDAELTRGRHAPTGKSITFGEIWREWIAAESPEWGLEYTKQCQRALKTHLQRVALIKTADLTGDHFQAVLHDMDSSTRGEQKKLIQKVQPCLKWAYRERLIPRPHTDYLGRLKFLPKKVATVRTRSDAMTISPEEVPTARFIFRMAEEIARLGQERAGVDRRNNVHYQRFGEDAALAMLLQAHTGLRQGELRALTLGDFLWTEIGLSGRIRVTKNYREHAGGQREIKAPKNDKNRVIRLPAWTSPLPDKATLEPQTAESLLRKEFPDRDPNLISHWDFSPERREILAYQGLIDLRSCISEKIARAREADADFWPQYLFWPAVRDRRPATNLPSGAATWPPNGAWTPIDGFRRYWWSAAKARAGFSDAPWTPRHLRHYAASQFLRSGMPLTEVADQLGHANPDITLRVYSRMFHSNAETPWSLHL